MSGMDAYTMSEHELIEHYQELTEALSDKAIGKRNAEIARRTIANIKADAWDEAFQATCVAHDQWGGLNYEPTNPYR